MAVAPRHTADRFLPGPIDRDGHRPIDGLAASKSSVGSHYQGERQGVPPLPVELVAALADIQPIRLVPVISVEERLVWNATMAKYHPLGYQRPFGARQYYWIVSEAGPTPRWLGGLVLAPQRRRYRRETIGLAGMP